MSLPDHYASPLHLPFNRTCLDQQFLLESPDQEIGTGGYWVLLKGNTLVVTENAGRLALPQSETPPVAVSGEPL